jgi:branched-chain amino acid transport system permease protein
MSEDYELCTDGGAAPATGEDAASANETEQATSRVPGLGGDEGRIIGLTALAVLLFPFLFAEAPVISDIIQGYAGLTTLILIWGIFAMGYDLLHGFTGLLSFGHAAFWGAGGMAAGLLVEYAGMNLPLVLVVVGTIVGVLLAWLIGFLSLRRGGIYFAILTLAFGQMIYFTIFGPAGPITGGEDGLLLTIGDLFGVIPLNAGVPVLTPLGFIPSWLYLIVGIFVVISVAVAYRVLNSPYGLIFKAIRENEQRAEFVGLNVWRYKLMAFILSGAFAGFAGALHTIYNGAASASAFYWIVSGDVVIMSILGGVGTLFGAFLGAGVYLYMSNILETFVGTLWHVMLGLLFVVVVWLFPGGIWGGIRALRDLITDLIGGGGSEPEAATDGGEPGARAPADSSSDGGDGQ